MTTLENYKRLLKTHILLLFGGCLTVEWWYWCGPVAAGPGQYQARPGLHGLVAISPSQPGSVGVNTQSAAVIVIVHCTIPPPCLTPHKQWKHSSSSSSLEKMQDKVSLLLVFLTLNFELDFVNPQRYEPKEVPVFDEHLPSVSTVQQGDTAYLNCRIFHAENM